MASGKGFSAGTSNILAIEMTYGSEAQPDIRVHMEHVEAWLRYYDKYKDSESKKQLMEAAWCKALARIEKRRENGSKETNLMRSAMSASIINLRLIDIAPRSIHRWANERKGEEGIEKKLGEDQNVRRREMLEVLIQSFKTRMWQNVTEGEATGGLEKGTPSLEQVKRCQRWLNKKGRGDQAKCAESIAIHGVWNAARLHTDKTLHICSRCGKDVETLKHRFCECCENKKIESEDVIKSQKLCEQAKKQWESRGACFWNGGASPHNLRAE